MLLVARRPQILLTPEFRVEDGQTFFLGTYFGSPLDGVLRPYEGYLHVVPRLIALLERVPPIQFAPLVANLAAIAIAVAVACYLASGRLAAIIPNQRTRLALAALVIVAPGTAELIGSMTYAQWFLDVFLIAAAIAPEPSSRQRRVIELCALALAAMSGLASLFIAPLHVAAAVANRSRWRVATASITTIAAAVQLTLLLTSTREPHGGGTLYDATGVVAVRAVVEPILGARITTLIATPPVIAVVAVVIAGLLVFAVRDLPRRWLFVLGYVWVASVAAVLEGSINTYHTLLGPVAGEHYFYVPGLIVGAVVVLAIAHRRRAAAVALAALLVVGVVADFWIRPLNTHDWPARSACIGGVDPCLVPVEPVSVWTIRWPGQGGQYSQTRARVQ
ncbi:MAG TPA: hypothetical protein VE011_09710 [Candidatus Dormibacteraeota bacterium]|nr:hypothetical protein [Candidatus Dormibacteraeota bacterium]